MTKIISVVLLAIASSSAMAEWVKIGGNEKITTYVDPATISKTDDVVKMWGLTDLKEARKEESGKSFKSAKGLQEYDCKSQQSRKITLSLFSESMGKGEVVHTYSDAEKWKWVWTPVTPGTINETMWKNACGKK